MNTKIVMATFATFLAVMLAFSTLAMAVGEEGDVYETEYDSVWATTAPVLDGVISEGEYSEDAMAMIDFTVTSPDRNETIYVYIMNDADWIYVGVDVLADNTSNEGDFCYIAFDDDNNGIYDMYAPQLEGTYVVYMANVSDDATERLIPVASETTQGFLYYAGFDVSVNDEDVDHMAYEFKIPISNFKQGELELGDTLAMHIEGELTEEWTYPIDSNTTVATNWAEITLADEPTVTPVDDGYTAQDYGVIIMGFGAIIATVLALFYQQTELQWIADQNMKAYLISKIAVVGLLLAGLLQYYYDWLSWLGF